MGFAKIGTWWNPEEREKGEIMRNDATTVMFFFFG